MEQVLYHKTRYRLVLKFDVRIRSSVADASSLSKSKTPGNSNHKFITELFRQFNYSPEPMAQPDHTRYTVKRLAELKFRSRC